MGKLLTGKNSIMWGIKNLIWKIKNYSGKKKCVLPLKNTLLYKKVIYESDSISDMLIICGT